VKVKKPLHQEEVLRIAGRPSREVAERCPDGRITYPKRPCTNLGCDFRINEKTYMNCMFVAAEAGEHTLEAIGEMLNITREGARLIERKALLKLRHSRMLENAHAPVHQPSLVARPNLDASFNESTELADTGDELPAFDGRKLA